MIRDLPTRLAMKQRVTEMRIRRQQEEKEKAEIEECTFCPSLIGKEQGC